MWVPPVINWNELRNLDRVIAGMGVAVGEVPKNPLASLMTDWMGVTNTVYAITDIPAEVDKTLDALAQSHWEGHLLACQSPPRFFSFNDNISVDNIGSYFRDYASDYYRKGTNALHDSGKFVYLHTDGTLRGLLPMVESAGFDAFEAFTPQPVGDVPVENLRDGLGERFIFWGRSPRRNAFAYV